MARRYYEHKELLELFNQNGFKPAGTLGSHCIKKMRMLEDDAIEIIANQKCVVKKEQLLVYNCGDVYARTPSALGKFKIKIEKAKIGDVVHSHYYSSFQRADFKGISHPQVLEYDFEEGDGEVEQVHNMQRSDDLLKFVAMREGLAYVSASFRQHGFGQNYQKFVIVGNYKVTKNDINKIKRLLGQDDDFMVDIKKSTKYKVIEKSRIINGDKICKELIKDISTGNSVSIKILDKQDIRTIEGLEQFFIKNMKNCTNCEDCISSIGCENCIDCTSCTNCTNCEDCKGSKDCTDCKKSDYCYKCKNCQECNSCMNCTGCIVTRKSNNCIDCYGCEGANKKERTKKVK